MGNTGYNKTNTHIQRNNGKKISSIVMFLSLIIMGPLVVSLEKRSKWDFLEGTTLIDDDDDDAIFVISSRT